MGLHLPFTCVASATEAPQFTIPPGVRISFRPPRGCLTASGKPALIEVRMNPEQVTNRCSIRELRAQASGKEK